MSVVWTTIAIIALLLPGIFFFIGLATYERLSREIIRSGVVSEVALATMVAILLHTLSLSALSAVSGFRLSAYILPLANYDTVPHAEMIVRLCRQLVPIVLYLTGTAAIGFSLGVLVAIGILTGWLRFLAKHKWIYDVIDRSRKGGIVTAFVMTTIIEDGKVLMYRGRLHEVFLIADGKVSYVILKNCARFYMTFGDEAPTIGKQLELFDGGSANRRKWDYLLIDGDNIANILFDPSAETLRTSDEGMRALQEEVRRQREDLRARFREAYERNRSASADNSSPSAKSTN